MKKVLSLGLALLMLLGCLGALAEESAGVEDWRTPYAEPITVVIANEEHAGAIFPEGDSIYSNVWTRAFQEKYNVTVQTEWVSDEYETKMNLAIASKSLPDVFLVKTSQFQQLMDAGYPADLTEAFETYASDEIKNYMEVESAIFDTAKKDGKLYGIPHLHYGNIDKPGYLWIRKDWMEETGIEAPTTIDEFEEAMKAFVENGADYGIAIDQTLDHLMFLTPGFKAYYDIWVKDAEGNIAYSSIQPEMKTALETFAAWYKEGLIKQDFATMDYNAMMEDVINGKVGMQPFQQWWGYAAGTDVIKNNNVDAYFEPYEIPSVDGSPSSHPVKFPNTYYAVVNPDYEHPEVLLKLMSFSDYICCRAVIDGDITLDEMMEYTDGNRAHIPGPFRIQNPIAELDQFHQVQEALQTGDTSNFTSATGLEKYQGVKSFLEDGEAGAINIGHVLQLGGEKCAYRLGEGIVNDNRFVLSELWGATPEQLANYGSTLNDLLKEGFTKIIMGVEPIDYFDTLVESWKAAGGDDATAAMNAMYNN